MHGSRRTALVGLIWLMAHSILAADVTWAQSTPGIPATGSDEPATCLVSKDRTIILPASLSIAQKGYLSELCDKVMRFQNRLLGANPMEQPTVIGTSEFENAKLLYELDQQHVANMQALIEKAVAVHPFPEEAFWAAWLNERHAYRQATSPLIHHQAELILRNKNEKAPLSPIH